MTETKYAPETGLPELPEGHFWRLAPEGYGRGVEVEIRRKRLGLRALSVLVAHGTIYGTGAFATSIPYERVEVEDVRRTAERVLETWASRSRGRSIFGDYPPKSLGGAK